MDLIWQPLQIEKDLKEALVEDFDETTAEYHYGEYTKARNMLPQVWEEIKRREPNLTDHGPRHIADVLGQAHQLVPKGHFNARELLALTQSILFHDTGNIHGRNGHAKKISDIHSFVRGANLNQQKLEEKKILLAVVGAHGGEARDGSNDTIGDLEITESYLRRTIRIQEVAAVLRFADELAEGPHRTSEYLRRKHDFPVDAEEYHDYASITSICIDTERIALTYQINLSTQNGNLAQEEIKRLERLLNFAYHRIRKLDEERQYARYYTEALARFKRTSATFNFWVDDEPRELGLRPLELDDLVVPGGPIKAIPELNSDYEIGRIIENLNVEGVK